MKRIINIIIPFLALAVLAVGCMSEPEEAVNPAAQGSKTLTFTLPANSSVVTYVDSEGDEDVMNGMVIYMFNTDTKMLERIFRGAEIVAGTNTGGKPTATIDVTERTGPKTFYFVANHAAITSDFGKVKFNKTTLDEFEQTITDVQTALPVTPLLMSFKQEVADVEDVQAAELDIKMTRRVARFDVDNVAATTNFTIKNIVVGNVNQQAYVFGDAPEIPGKVLTAGDITPNIVFDTISGANTGLVKSVFYTYPTKLGEGFTDISFEGTFNGQTRVYSLKPDQPMQIEANKRYTLKAKTVPITDIEFEITITDWDEGVVIDSETEKNVLQVINMHVAEGPGKLSADQKSLALTSAVDATTTMKFVTRTYRAEGTRIEIEYLEGGQSIMAVEVNDPPIVLTYGAAYEQQYVARFTRKSNLDAHVRVKIINANDPFQRQFLDVTQDIQYPGVTFKPVKVDGTWFAPVNVGATTINKSVSDFADIGYFYQWGRSDAPFKTSGFTILANPQTAAVASANKTKFITSTAAPYDWLSTPNDNLWNGDDRRGPCPEGWRVPNNEELSKILQAWKDGKTNWGTNVFEVTGDNGDTLYLPSLAEHINYSNGVYYAPSRQAASHYWSSSLLETQKERACYLLLYKDRPGDTNPDIIIGASWRAQGFNVRCVADK